MALSLRRLAALAVLLLRKAQGQATVSATCERVTTMDYNGSPKGLVMDDRGIIFVSGGRNLWAVDRTNFSSPRLLATASVRSGYDKILAREEDLLVVARHPRNEVLAISKNGDGGDDTDATVVVRAPSAHVAGLALAPDGDVLVAEAQLRRVSRWSPNGTFSGLVAAFGDDNPYTLALSRDTGRVCSTSASKLYCYSLNTSVPVELVKTGVLLAEPFFDQDDNLWLLETFAESLTVLKADGTEVTVELQGVSNYKPHAMVFDAMDDAKFFLLGSVSNDHLALFLCGNPLFSRTNTTTSSTWSSTQSSTWSSTTSATLSSTTLSSTTSATLSSTTSTDTGTSSTPPSTATTGTTPGPEVTMRPTTPPGTTAGTDSPAAPAAERSSTADVGGKVATSGGHAATLSTTPHSGVPSETSAVPTQTAAPGSTMAPATAAPTRPPHTGAETPAVPTSAAPGSSIPSATAMETSTKDASSAADTETTTVTMQGRGVKVLLEFSGMDCAKLNGGAMKSDFIAAVEEGILQSVKDSRIQREHITTEVFCVQVRARRLQQAVKLVAESTINFEAAKMPMTGAFKEVAAAAIPMKMEVQRRVRAVPGIDAVTLVDELPTLIADPEALPVMAVPAPRSKCLDDVCVTIATSEVRRGATLRTFAALAASGWWLL